jgi:integrase/recombinase XerD
VHALVCQFLDHLTAERGASPHTCASYGNDLRQFCTWLREHGVQSPAEIQRPHIVGFLMDSRQAGLRSTTLARRLASIRAWLRYLREDGLLACDVAETMDSPRLWRMLPSALTTREVERLLAAPDTTQPRGLRDRAILELLYATGLRVSELAGLTLDRIHPEERFLRCLGKGRKERVVPFGESARGWLLRYLEEVRPAWAARSGTSYVFLSHRGTPLDRRTIWRRVRTYAQCVGLSRDVHPHTLRHTFATHLLANQAPLRVIQELLGHASIATTQVYTHVDTNRLKSIHERFHPRA